jgi:hypothetical protein
LISKRKNQSQQRNEKKLRRKSSSGLLLIRKNFMWVFVYQTSSEELLRRSERNFCRKNERKKDSWIFWSKRRSFLTW